MADDDSEEEKERDFGDDELQEIQEAYGMYSVQQEDEVEEEEATGPKGLLPTASLPYAMKEIGFDPTEAEVFVMLDEVDPHKTGFLDFKTFLYLLKKHIKPLNEEQLRIAFSVFDRDGIGFIGTAEIKYVTRNLGERYTDEEIEDMLKEVDADGDGKINFEDFCYFMTKH
ncbi:calmodulin-2/4-like [Coccinella septempunctata]|uniref:calmodulin-2/4-like n=1 Tax=Coccinella septempunctata TaxID=41139 RepID=UPI001D0706C4|nr:calmodulin-2/4-like [Coccinella septempunctata]